MAEQTPPSPPDPSVLKRRLGKVGVWLMPFDTPAEDEKRVVLAIEQLGYGTFWFGEASETREAFTQAAMLLAGTERIQIATGIANIHARDPIAAANAARTLSDAWPGRFVLGLGVSHEPMVSARGHDYSRPLSAMRSYLDGMDAAPYAPPLSETPPRVLAALRPKMMELAGTRAQGAHTYCAPVEHTARARETLGADAVLAVELGVVMETDPEKARAAARGYASYYLVLPNYVNHLRELGFTDEDFKDGGSDAILDAIVAWGDADTIAERVRAHHEAGADHVCVMPIAATIEEQAEQLRRLAPVLTT